MTLPALVYLSKKYDLYYALHDSHVPFFQNYDFLNLVVYPKGQQLDHVDWHQFAENIKHYNFDICASKMSSDVEEYKLLGLPFYERNRFSHNTNYAENILKTYHATVLDTQYPKSEPKLEDGIKRIVLYISSHEVLRRIPDSLFIRLYEELIIMNKVLGNKYKIIVMFDASFKKENILKAVSDKFEVKTDMIITNSSFQSARDVIDLFASGVDLLIGADSGITHLAIMYDTKCYWLETRERMEVVYPKEYHDLFTVTRLPEPSCKKDCFARNLYNIFGDTKMDIVPFDKMKHAKPYPRALECLKFKEAPCMDYKEEHIQSMLNTICSLLV